MSSSLAGVTYAVTIFSLLCFIAVMMNPFRGFIFRFLSDIDVNFSDNMLLNPYTYLLLLFIASLVLSMLSLSEKTQLYLKYLCVLINGTGSLVVGFIVFMGVVL